MFRHSWASVLLNLALGEIAAGSAWTSVVKRLLLLRLKVMRLRAIGLVAFRRYVFSRRSPFFAV